MFPSYKTKMEAASQPLTVFAKSSTLDAWQDFECASDLDLQ